MVLLFYSHFLEHPMKIFHQFLKHTVLSVVVIAGISTVGSPAASAQQKGQEKPQVQAQQPKLDAFEQAYNFLVIGDWGRQGEYNQAEVGEQMGKFGKDLDIQFVISTGDHFYPNGIAGVDDRQWLESFENIYKAHSLHCDWYPVLGNHDYRGDPESQIEYSKRSRRWQLKQHYYTIEKAIDKKNTALFVFLDTPPLIRQYYKELDKTHIGGQDTTRQYFWLDSVLAASKAQWKIVVGHHHVFTGGKRAPEQPEMVERVKPLLEKYGVQAYFNGHEHDLQVIKRGTVHYFVSGAGSEMRPTGKIEGTLFSAEASGFMAVSMLGEQMLVQVIDHTGKILYKTVVKRS
jgi:tartrate-resistant acid phosphatase type 5